MKITLCDTDAINDALYLQYEKIISEETRQRANRFRRESDRRATIIGEALTRLMLAEELNEPPESIPVFRTENGKPYINKDIYFNISHTSGTVAVAVSEYETGIDIEKLRTPPLSAINSFCTEREKDYILSPKTPEETQKRFFTLWTLKESYLKCTGEGLSGGLRSIEFSVKDDAVICSDPGFSFLTKETEGGIILSAAVKCDDPIDIQIFIANYP